MFDQRMAKSHGGCPGRMTWVIRGTPHFRRPPDGMTWYHTLEQDCIRERGRWWSNSIPRSFFNSRIVGSMGFPFYTMVTGGSGGVNMSGMGLNC